MREEREELNLDEVCSILGSHRAEVET